MTSREFWTYHALVRPPLFPTRCINSAASTAVFQGQPILLRVTLSISEKKWKRRRFIARPVFVRSCSWRRHLIRQSRTTWLVVSRSPQPFLIHLDRGRSPCRPKGILPVVGGGCRRSGRLSETYDSRVLYPLHTAPARSAILIGGWLRGALGYAASFRRPRYSAVPGRQLGCGGRACRCYLLKHCWRAQITVGLPRLSRTPAGESFTTAPFHERSRAVVCAFRITFPQVSLVLSTREALRPCGNSHSRSG